MGRKQGPLLAAQNSAIDLSIIVLSWNTRELLRGCLASLQAALRPGIPPAVEVIVVDNASTDGSAELVARDFAEFRLLRNAENAGFARGNNAGLALSAGRHAMLLNCDTIVPAAAIAGLVNFMDAHPAAGACSPRLARIDGSPQPYAYGGDPELGYLLRRGLRRVLRSRPLHDWAVAETIEVDWVSGACLLARRRAIEQVGGLDESFFMYFEDSDWCLRMRQAGWRIYYVPAASITHIGGQGLARNPAARAAYYRSLSHFYDKHYGPASRGLMRMALAAYRTIVRH